MATRATRQQPKMDSSDGLNQLLKLLRPEYEILDVAPEGYHSTDQLAALTGSSPFTVQHRMTRLIKDGKVDIVKVRTITGNGRKHPVPYYKLK